MAAASLGSWLRAKNVPLSNPTSPSKQTNININNNNNTGVARKSQQLRQQMYHSDSTSSFNSVESSRPAFDTYHQPHDSAVDHVSIPKNYYEDIDDDDDVKSIHSTVTNITTSTMPGNPYRQQWRCK
jgi:hypothetical protein